MSPLSKITNLEISTQLKFVKYHNCHRVNASLIHNTIPVLLYNVLLRFRDTGEEFELKRDLSKMITNKNYKVDLASLVDKKLHYDSAKEMYFDVKGSSNKYTGDRTLIKLLKLPGLMISASGISNTVFLPSGPNNFCQRIKLRIREKHAGMISDIINKEIVVILDKILQHISKKQHYQTIIKGNLLQTKEK